MSLAASLLKKFLPHIRQRGQQCYKQKRVRILDGSSSLLIAEVDGTFLYTVTLEYLKGKLRSACTCPYGGDFPGGCKHLWAAILAAEQEGYLSDIPLAIFPSGRQGGQTLPGRRGPAEPTWKMQLAAISSS